MKKYIKFGYHLLCSRLAMNVLVIIQLAVTFALLQGMISYTADQYKTVSAYEPLSRVHGVYFLSLMERFPDTLFEQVQALDDGIEVATGGVYHPNFSDPMDRKTICFYSPIFADYYKPPLSEGIWFSDYRQQGPAAIPAGAGSGAYTPGDRFDAGIAGMYYEVIGVLEQPFVFSFESGGSEPGTNLVMQPGTDRFLSIVTSDAVADFYDTHASVSSNRLFLSDSDDFVQQAKQILKEYGYPNSFADIREFGVRDANTIMQAILPFFVFMLVLSLLGLIGCVALSVVRHRKLFAVLCLVGGTRRSCVGIAACYIALLTFFALLPFRLASYFLFTQRLAPRFEWLSIISIVALCILIMATAIIPMVILKKHAPLETFRRAA